MPSIAQHLGHALRAAATAGCLAMVSLCATAQPAAQKTLRIIVPYAPGGLLDSMMRRMGPLITESTGQTVIIDNRPGGVTNIGMTACASAPADGGTVCFALEDSTVYNPLLFKKLPYDPSTLVPVIQLATSRGLIVASASAPFNSYREMLAYARSRPETLNFGTWGPGTTPDLYRQWINRMGQVQMTAVPYKGVAGGTMQAILSGEIDASVYTVGQVQAHLKDGKLKPIAVLGDKRVSMLPSTPTLAEEGADPGLPSVWGIYAPPRTPKAEVDRLNAEFGKALAHPGVREMLQAATLEPVGGSPDDMVKALRDLRTNANRVFNTLGIKPADLPG